LLFSGNLLEHWFLIGPDQQPHITHSSCTVALTSCWTTYFSPNLSLLGTGIAVSNLVNRSTAHKKAALGAFSPGFASPVDDGAKVVTFVHQ
jgi:hypothetical protein